MCASVVLMCNERPEIVIVDRVRDRVREKIMSVDRGSCFVIVKQHRETRTF
jgi:hypothetical protein